MAKTLHAAIRHALADSPAYRSRGILVSTALTAEADLNAEGDVLYNAVYTLFCALPWRVVPGTSVYITTFDVASGIELAWECREEPQLAEGTLRDVLRQGPHGDLVDIALDALEGFCGMRGGECVTERTPVVSSPQFPRSETLLRRVRAYLPAAPGASTPTPERGPRAQG